MVSTIRTYWKHCSTAKVVVPSSPPSPLSASPRSSHGPSLFSLTYTFAVSIGVTPFVTSATVSDRLPLIFCGKPRISSPLYPKETKSPSGTPSASLALERATSTGSPSF